jgi:DNA-binding HxlR family transcriptional regulator
VLADRPTLRPVPNPYYGMRPYADIEKDLGIAKNVLSSRLQHLVEHEILERSPVGEQGSRHEYRLTPRGEALLPVLTSLREWSDEWIYGRGNEPILVKDRRTGRRLPRLQVRDAEGRPLSRRDLRSEPGPGATEETLARFRRPRERSGRSPGGR